MNSGSEKSNPLRLVTRHKVSLAFTLPRSTGRRSQPCPALRTS
jgi:hypothetical protein